MCGVYNTRFAKIYAKALNNLMCILCISSCVCEIILSSIILANLHEHRALNDTYVDSDIRLDHTFYYCCAMVIMAIAMGLVHGVNFIMVNLEVMTGVALRVFLWMHGLFFVVLVPLDGYILYVWQWRYAEPCRVWRGFDEKNWDEVEEYAFRIGMNGCTLVCFLIVLLHLTPIYFLACFSKALYDNFVEESQERERQRTSRQSRQRLIMRSQSQLFKPKRSRSSSQVTKTIITVS